jgi:Family of unknown function (DUF6545)
VAAAAALLSAIQAVVELARDRSPALTAWVLSMMFLGASLVLEAVAAPDMLQSQAEAATWACWLSILGTWAFAEVLAMTSSNSRRVADLMTLPLLGSTSAALLLIGLHWAAIHRPQDAKAATIGVQLTLVVYYAPALGQIATVAQQRGRSAPPSWARVAMRAVAMSAAAELVLTIVRSAVLAAGASGTRVGSLVIGVIAALQGVAVTCGIGALAAGPVVTTVATRCQPWLAYRQLRPLWAALKEVAPDVELSVQKGEGHGIRGRLLRRVIEIRDAEQALSPYWSQDVASRARTAARTAALSADLEQAVIEAAVIMDAASARLRGDSAVPEPLQAAQFNGRVDGDLYSEVERLVLVSRAILQCPIIHEMTVEP